MLATLRRPNRCKSTLFGEFRFPRGLAVLALGILGIVELFSPLRGAAASASCSLAAPAFCDTFDQGPSPVRGRAGDLNPAKWSVGHLAPSDFSRNGVVNPVSAAPIPACKA